MTRRLLSLIAALAFTVPAVAGCSGGTTVSAAPVVDPAPGAAQTPFRLGSPTPEMAVQFLRRCQNANAQSRECAAFRTILVFELSRGLQKGEIARDQRAVPHAMAALDLAEEPEIIIAASRLLGRFPETAGLVDRMLPQLLTSAFTEVQHAIAQLFAASPDPAIQDLGRMWVENHDTLRPSNPYAQYPDFPAHYDTMGFPKYAGAESFSPADSDRSIGWSTKDDAAAVVKWYGDTLHAEAMNADTWFPMSTDQSLLLLKPDQAKTTRMQQLMERLMRGDQTAQAEFDKLSAEVDSGMKIASEAAERNVVSASMVASTFARDARWIIAAKKGERISRMVMIFSIPAIHRTVIKEIWDLSDFPSAWPKERSR